ncbi:hypothetical protein AGABI1DRAFT_135267 [Agaricus bisporus var. burnettii JB137-S8]|uniref:Uncharacterized protein n=1 Tax=Agaricus bisporus var. burnettii (strain JB137-S8 / ATCC MYA-4627 / FGSC 10392) TaxID=597362 RepID=K5WR62_AGABU|nr:uncharacterized protein AGABI1DRAFT_135267 [Agaricus bisporus var. burnettii JB137-S8]EKM73238.1 hypothetical protein AGABI1DRAFT_135267 [Agaricus bisporus var. burnettii JB137-S8]
MADHRDRPYPARPSRPSSPSGSTSIKSFGSPKQKRKNFIETGLEEHRERERTLFERADLEIVPTSQESEKVLE